VGGLIIPIVLWAGQLGVVDENVLIIERPVVVPPVIEVPVVETPVVETPAVETPVVETPVVETPVVETPAVETPAVETPVVEVPLKPGFSGFVSAISSSGTDMVLTPSEVLASLDDLDPVEVEEALRYLEKIIDNPAIPLYDKGEFARILDVYTANSGGN